MTKKKPKSQHKKNGRPLTMTKDKLQKLEEAFEWWCTDTEACLHAGISPSTLYNYQEKHKDFLQRKDMLKDKPILLARKAVLHGIVWWKIKAIKAGEEVDIYLPPNPELALKYLERKKKDEFSTRVEQTGKDWKDQTITTIIINKDQWNHSTSDQDK